MERENLPDYGAEAFYRYLIPENVFECSDETKQEAVHCIDIYKKLHDDVCRVPAGIAAVKGQRNYFNDEVCLITPSRKLFLRKLEK
jgi:hypothetical protein